MSMRMFHLKTKKMITFIQALKITRKSTYGLNFDLQTIYPVLIAACFHILIDNDNHFKMVNHLPYCSIFSELMLFKVADLFPIT